MQSVGSSIAQTISSFSASQATERLIGGWIGRLAEARAVQLCDGLTKVPHCPPQGPH